MLSVVLAAVDAAAGAYLIQYAVRRERRDKDAVLAVGIFALEVLLEPGQLIGETPLPVDV